MTRTEVPARATNLPVPPGQQSSSEYRTVMRSVTVIMGAVIGLTFLFGFGNVLALGLRLVL
ncbi:hypothetical protein [Streptomyces sp. SBT349]|uniref:hypothetical protein n=1 Tax=Streptomyces sp. SBT349 TaxID=1580539 RepID=UPI000AD52584|nr:hypothetical protein [Streptomyces sp. SBT349]